MVRIHRDHDKLFLWNCDIISFYTWKTGDAKAFGKMIDKLPVEASLYGDSAYTNYGL